MVTLAALGCLLCLGQDPRITHDRRVEVMTRYANGTFGDGMEMETGNGTALVRFPAFIDLRVIKTFPNKDILVNASGFSDSFHYFNKNYLVTNTKDLAGNFTEKNLLKNDSLFFSTGFVSSLPVWGKVTELEIVQGDPVWARAAKEAMARLEETGKRDGAEADRLKKEIAQEAERERKLPMEAKETAANKTLFESFAKLAAAMDQSCCHLEEADKAGEPAAFSEMAIRRHIDHLQKAAKKLREREVPDPLKSDLLALADKAVKKGQEALAKFNK